MANVDARALERLAWWYVEESRPLTEAEREYLATAIYRLEPAYPVEESLMLRDYDLCRRWRHVVCDEAISLA